MAGGASHPARTAARAAARGGAAPRSAKTVVSVDASDFRKVLLATQEFSPELYKNLRKRLRTIGRDLITEMQSELGDSGPLTRGIASGLRASISKGNADGKGAGLRIRATAKDLPDRKKVMLKAYNRAAFRHPVFGDTTVWAEQPGRPYFGKVILDKREQIQSEVRLALAETISAVVAAGPNHH